MALMWLAILAALENPQGSALQDEAYRLENGPLTDADVLRIRKIDPGMTEACVAKLRAGGTKARPERTEDCYRMTPEQRWTGLWRYDFEWSQFCPAPAKTCSYEQADKRRERKIWLTFDVDQAYEARRLRLGALYAVEFVGRRTVAPGHFGHMGVFDGEVIVDRMISMRRIKE